MVVTVDQPPLNSGDRIVHVTKPQNGNALIAVDHVVEFRRGWRCLEFCKFPEGLKRKVVVAAMRNHIRAKPIMLTSLRKCRRVSLCSAGVCRAGISPF
jgi:hypothetical protein